MRATVEVVNPHAKTGTCAPSPRIRRITFETEADLLKLCTLAVVRILRASLSGMGNPGIDVLYPAFSCPSGEYMEAPCDGVRSNSSKAGRGSEVTGVKETNGGARFGWFTTGMGFRLSAVDLLETFDVDVGIEGRRGSGPALVCELLALLEDGAVVGAVAEDNGAARVFFTFEKIEETMAYDEWSFSSSSEKGLKDVRLATSSSFELLRDRVLGAALASDGLSGVDFGESIVQDPVIKRS